MRRRISLVAQLTFEFIAPLSKLDFKKSLACNRYLTIIGLENTLTIHTAFSLIFFIKGVYNI